MALYLSRLALVAAWFGALAAAQQYVISTVAGGVGAATPQPAVNASISPSAVSADPRGNVYFADDSQTVYKVDLRGVLTRVAGNGHPGFSGDGGPAVNAQLNFIKGLAADSSGNLFIVCYLGGGIVNNTGVRKVSPDGIISTIAGGGGQTRVDGGPALGTAMAAQGIALDSTGNLYITDNLCNCIREITTDGIIHIIGGSGMTGFGGDGGPARSAPLSPNPLNAIAVDSVGNVYFVVTRSNTSGTLGNCIRKISTSGIITSLAGGCITGIGNGPFTNLTGIAIDTAGKIYAGDYTRVVEVSKGVAAFAGTLQSGFSGDGGPAIAALLGSVGAVALDNNGNLFIVDVPNRRIRRVDAEGVVATIAGNGLASYSGDGGPATVAQLNSPAAVVAGRSGNVYIADAANCRVRMVSPDGVIRTVAGDGVCGPATEGVSAILSHIGPPAGLALDSTGSLYLSVGTYPAVWRIASDGTLHRVAGTTVPANGAAGDGGGALSAGLFAPMGLAFDASGNLYVADVSDFRVRKIAPDGSISTVAGNGGTVYTGEGGQAVKSGIGGPHAVALDRDGNLYIAAGYLLKVSPQGVTSVVAGCVSGCAALGASGVPARTININVRGVALGSDGAIYAAGNVFVYRITADGTATLIAGDLTAAQTYTGDGGPALSAGIQPEALSVDGSGRIYVADAFNDVRILQPVAPLTVVNSASNIAGAIVPGEIVTLYGSGLGPSRLTKGVPGDDGSYSTQLEGFTVSIGGLPAPVLYIWDTQTAVIVPYGISGSTASITVAYDGKATASTSVSVTGAAPAVFTADSSGKGAAAALNQDSTPNSAFSPAHTGETIVFFATGEGQTSPPGRDGQPASAPFPKPLLPVALSIGGQPATVQYAGGAPGEVAGVMQVNVQIPTGISTGDAVPVVLKVGTAVAPGVTIAVR